MMDDYENIEVESRADTENIILNEIETLPEDNLRGFALMISKLLFRLAQL